MQFFCCRTLIFHGVNAVYKIPPWYPTTTGFDSTTTLSDIDAANLKKWGFNIVRLGVMWPGVEPGERGAYDQVYLDQIETIVTNLAKNDIHVILDFHQDLWHRKFCGEGVPDYVFNICKAAEPAGTKQFPLPAVNTTYPTDADGNPTLEACLSKMFATYYLSAEVGAGFQCLYDNVDNLWDAFSGYWVAIAKRFSTFDNVLGYELINEPWAGDVYQSPKNLLPKVAEQTYLQPLYQYVHKAIRAVDDEKIIFFEGLTIDYWPGGFSEGPGGQDYNDRQMLAYHVYCPTDGGSAVKQLACNAIDDFFFAMRNRDAERMGVGMIMTEFGAAEDIKSDLQLLIRTTAMADKYQQSWMYWQFKYYQDITTCTPQGESLYQDDGNVCMDKLEVLSRTYPQAVAGSINDYSFNVQTKGFDMKFHPVETDSYDQVGSKGHDSVVYVNKEMFYPHGFEVSVNVDGIEDSANFISYKCPTLVNPNWIHFTQNSGSANPDAVVEVKIMPCNPLDGNTCTCR
jgi:endoglycosylceramidase